MIMKEKALNKEISIPKGWPWYLMTLYRYDFISRLVLLEKENQITMNTDVNWKLILHMDNIRKINIVYKDTKEINIRL